MKNKKKSDTSVCSQESEDSNLDYKGIGVHDSKVGEARRVYFPEGVAPPVKPSNALVCTKSDLKEPMIYQRPHGTNPGG